MTVTTLKQVVLAVVLKAFYSRREEEELASNDELFELLVLTTRADRRGELCGAAQRQNQNLSRNNWSHDNTMNDHMFLRYPRAAFCLHGHTAFKAC